MWLLNTSEVIEKLKGFYIENYKTLFESYKAELNFATILTYYSGSCALIVEIKSVSEAHSSTNICIMLECSETELINLDDQTMHSILQHKILDKNIDVFELNKVLCDKYINKKVIIKNTSFNEPVVSIKMDKEAIYIDLNYSKIREEKSEFRDLLYILDGISDSFEKLL